MRSVREDEQSEANPLRPDSLAPKKKRHELLSDGRSQSSVTSSRGWVRTWACPPSSNAAG